MKDSKKSNKKDKKDMASNKTYLKYEVLGIACIAFALICMVSLFNNSLGIVGNFIRKIFFVLTGEGRVLLPVIFIILGIRIIRTKEQLKISSKIWGYSLLLIAVLTWIHTNIPLESGFDVVWDDNQGGGGLIGAMVSFVLLKLFGLVGTYIILVAMLVISVILITELQFQNVVSAIRSLIKKIRESRSGAEKTFRKPKMKKNKEEAKKKRNWPDSGTESDMSEVNNDDSQNSFSGPVQPAQPQGIDQPCPDTSELVDQQVIHFNPADGSSEDYVLPSLELLTKPLKLKNTRINKDVTAKINILEKTLQDFGIQAEVINVSHGPSITRYEIKPPSGVKVSRIVGLADDIALKLAAPSIRIEAPIPGKAALGIEVPNETVSMVHLRDLLDSNEFNNSFAKLSVALGMDIAGKPVIIDLAKMPHLLIAGATGSGKSVCINALISSILFKARPDEVKFLLIDPKRVELTDYNGIPHLISPVVTNAKKASAALKWAVKEMEDRYNTFSRYSVRNLESYNVLANENKTEGSKPMPQIVVLIDELADLMIAAPKEVEESICRLTQMSRAAGIYLVIATQRPSVDVITGLIKSNIPSRISFAVSSQIDSRTILDMAGAERLLGKGDMLYLPIAASKPQRLQGPYLSDQEIANLVAHLKKQKAIDNKEEVISVEDPYADEETEKEQEDNLFLEAVRVAVENGQISGSFLQRKLKIGYNRAARIVDAMERHGYVSGYDGGKPRTVLLNREQYEKLISGEKPVEAKIK